MLDIIISPAQDLISSLKPSQLFGEYTAPAAFSAEANHTPLILPYTYPFTPGWREAIHDKVPCSRAHVP